MILRLAIPILLMVVTWAPLVFAQPGATVGAMRGVITDGTAPATGAVVIVTSPALQGEQTTITDERGTYFVSALPPGVYQLTVYYLERRYARNNVLVQLGKEVVVNVALTQASGGEVITIQGRAPLVDQGSTKLGVTITEDYTRNIPTGRTFADVVGTAAGAQRDRYGISLSGTTSPETAYIVDGIPATDPLYASLSTELPPEFISETEVITGGYNAEYGRSTGGMVNVITKRGSNTVRGSVFAHYAPAALASEAATIQREGSAIDARTELGTSYDMGAEMGGPLVADRLWFHAGFAPRVTRDTRVRVISHQTDEDQDGNPDIDPKTGFTVHEQIASASLPRRSTTTYFTAKLTGAVDDNHRGELSAFGNPGRFTEVSPFGLTRAPATLMWSREAGSYNAVAKWTSKLAGGATELDASAGFHRTYELPHARDERPVVRYQYERSLADFADVEDANLDACVDTNAEGSDRYPKIVNCPVFGYSEQGVGGFDSRRDDRLAAAASLTQRAKLAGYHVLKLGIDYEHAGDRTSYHFTGGFGLVRSANSPAGAPGRWRLNELMRVVRNLTPEERASDNPILGPGEEQCPHRDAVCVLADPVTTSTSSGNVGTYAQDSWLVAPNLTLNAGVRWDHQTGYVADDVVGSLTPTGETIGDRVFSLDNVAPRVGVVYDPSRQGLAKLFAHYGRFYETLPLTASDLYANAMFTTVVLNGTRLRNTSAGYDPSCEADHGTPDIADTVHACSDRADRDTGQSFEFVSPGLRGQYTDEIVIGAEHQVLPDLKVGVAYQRRRVPIVIDDVSMDGGNVLFITNPGESFDAEAAKLRAQAERIEAAGDADLADIFRTRALWLEQVDELDKPNRNYHALQLTASLRPTARSLLVASYTYSSNRGNYPGLFSPETGQFLPNLNAFFDVPGIIPNRTGILGLDRPHNLHLDGFYRFDLGRAFAVTAGSSVRAQSGIAYSALATHPAYGAGESYLLTAGTIGRTPVTAQVDVHLGAARQFGSRTLEIFVDIFNLFDAQSTTNVDQRYTLDQALPVVDGTLDDLTHLKAIDDRGREQNVTIAANPNFGKASARQFPRVIQFGLRWLF